MQQGHHDIFLVPAIAMRARRGLQAVLHPVDWKSAKIAVEKSQMIKHPVCYLAGERTEMTANNLPVFLSAFFHRGKFSPYFVGTAHHALLCRFSGFQPFVRGQQ